MPTKAPVTKQIASKKVVKKIAPKKAVAGKAVKKAALVYADNPHSFWVSSGQILNSLAALHAALQVMDKAVYMHHVTKDRHDFADWVEVVLCDADCAKDLRKAKTAKSAHAVITKYLKTYNL